jgi:hypothetical protein
MKIYFGFMKREFATFSLDGTTVVSTEKNYEKKDKNNKKIVKTKFIVNENKKLNFLITYCFLSLSVSLFRLYNLT